MSNSSPDRKSEASPAGAGKDKVTPGRCLVGATISGPIAIALYFLTAAIAQTFATKPVTSSNLLVIKISIAVRTLVVGIATLGTGIFALVAVGLVALAIQLSIQSLKQRFTSSSDN